MPVCTICGEDKPKELFPRDKSKKLGRSSRCKSCQKGYSKSHYDKNKANYLTRQEVRRQSNRSRIIEIKEKTGCEVCKNESRHYVLDLHHRDSTEKEFNVCDGSNYSWEKIEKELEKCMIVCRNCHAEIHYFETQKELEKFKEPLTSV